MHTVRALADGVEFANVTITVTTLGLGEFPTGLSGEFTLSDFPQVGTETSIQWQQSQQNFVIVDGIADSSLTCTSDVACPSHYFCAKGAGNCEGKGICSGRGFVNKELLVIFEPGTTRDRAERIAAELGVSVIDFTDFSSLSSGH